MRKKEKKLHLSAETLRDLDLKRVAGGLPPVSDSGTGGGTDDGTPLPAARNSCIC